MSTTTRKGHPKGLYLLFFTEMWERFSYYGMRGILILYLTKSIIEGGLAIEESKASMIYGIFTGFVYTAPLIGGWLADKYIGKRNSITIGGFTMMLGQFILFSMNNYVGLSIGLILLVVGNGFFKPNISTIVGQLYEPDDPRKDSAFSIFYMGINIGAFFAPLLIGFIAEDAFAIRNEAGEILSYGYKYGFLASGIGMLLGQIIYNSTAQKYLGNLGKKGVSKISSNPLDSIEVNKKQITNNQKENIAEEDPEKLEEEGYEHLNEGMGFNAKQEKTTIKQDTKQEETTKQEDDKQEQEEEEEEEGGGLEELFKDIPFAEGSEEDFDLLPDFENYDNVDELPDVQSFGDGIAKLYQALTKKLSREPSFLDFIEYLLSNDAFPNENIKNLFTSIVLGFNNVASTKDKVSIREAKKAYDEIVNNPLPTFALNKMIKELEAENKEPVSEEEINRMTVTPTVNLDKKEGSEIFSNPLDGIEVPEEEKNKKLTKEEKDRVTVILILTSFVVFFWAGFEQAGSSLSLYTDKYIDRTIGFLDWTIPTSWFQSVNPLFIVALAPLFAILWNSKFGQKLSTPIKMGSGMILLGIGFLFMIFAVFERGGNIEDTAVKASLIWLIFTYLFHTIGELCLSPVGLSVVTKLSPLKYASILMGVWLFSSGLANFLGGAIASYVDALGALAIFSSIACFVMLLGLIMIALNKWIVKKMHGIK